MKYVKRIFYVLACILEIALIVGAYVFNYFTVRKMGMLRYVIFQNTKLEQNYPVFWIRLIVIAVLAIVAVLNIALFMKQKKKMTRLVSLMILVMVILVSVTVLFSALSSVDVRKAYYFIFAMFAAATLVQEIKTLVGIMGCRNEK